MNVSYKLVTTVRIEHEYDIHGHSQFIASHIPKEQSMKLMSSGVIFKAVANGFQLYNDCNSPWQGKLSIHLELVDNNFFNYTEINGSKLPDWSKSIFYFNTNNPANKEIKQVESYLHAGDTVADEEVRELKSPLPAADFNPQINYPDEFFKKPLGIIDIEIATGLKSKYIIRFQSKRSYWKYIVVSKQLKNILKKIMGEQGKPAIVDATGKSAFNAPEILTLGNGSDAIVFTSIITYPAEAISSNTFMLVEGWDETNQRYKKMLIKSLPNADYNQTSGLLADNKNEDNTRYCSEIYI